MKYKIFIKRSAEKEMDRLPFEVFERVVKKILSLAENPRPAGCKKLLGGKGYRVRVGNYTVDDKERIVEVVAVVARGKAYRKK